MHAKKYLWIVPIILLGSITCYGQETGSSGDDYSDYSYLWKDSEPTKKQKKKKQKKKKSKNVALTSYDSMIMGLDTISVATDSLLTGEEEAPSVADSLSSAEDTNTYDDYDYYYPGGEEEEETTEDAEQVNDFRTPMNAGSSGGSFTGGFTYTKIRKESYAGLNLSTEFDLGKVGIGLNIPILYGLESNSLRTEIFEDGVGPLRLITYARYGRQKQDQVYVKAGQLEGLMIGFGGLVNNYTNSASFEKRKVGIHFDVNYQGMGGLEGMYSDLNPSSVNMLALRPYVKPLFSTGIPVVSTFEIGATFVSDKDQTQVNTSDSTSTSYILTQEGVNAFGVDMGLTVFRSSFLQIDFFANYSKLNIESDTLSLLAALSGVEDFETGSGMAVGLNFRLNFIANVFHTDVRLERLNYSDHYLPQFFNAGYEINKDSAISRLVTAEAKSGIYGSLSGQILNKVSLGGALLVPDEITETSPAFLRFHAQVDRLMDKFSLMGSYTKSNLTDFKDAWILDQNCLAKVRFIYHLNSFLATGIDYYWAFTTKEDGRYKADETVMPYFGLNIAF